MNVLSQLLDKLPKPFRRGYRLKVDDLNLLVQVLRSVANITGPEVSVDHTGIHIRRPPQRQVQRRFRARIKASQAIGSINKWEYSVDEAVVDDSAAFSGPKWINKTGGFTSTLDADDFAVPAYNRFEDLNDGVSPEGMDVTLEGPGTAELTMLPIPIGMPVEVVEEVGDEGQLSYWFEAVNGYDRDCDLA